MAMAIPFLATLGTAGGTAAGTAATAAAAAGATGVVAGAAAPVAATVASTAAGLSGAQIAALAATGVSAGMSAVGMRQAGIAEDRAMREAAKQEKDAARGREIERRRGLLQALASQNATAGAQGVAFTGSKQAIARKDISEARSDLLYDTVNTRRNVRMLKARGSSARQAGDFGAASSLLDSGARAYNTFGGR